MFDILMLVDDRERAEDRCAPPDDWRDLIGDDVPPMTAAEERAMWIRLAIKLAAKRDAAAVNVDVLNR